MDEQQKCKCARTKERSDKEKTKLINRLSRIEGQVRGLKRMVYDDAYCTDILIQTSAVSSAIKAFNRELLSNHIRTCVANDIKQGNEQAIDELMDTLKKLM